MVLDPRQPALMGRKKGVTMSGDSSLPRISQLLTRASEMLPMKWCEGTTPYLPTDLPPDEEVKKAYLMLYSVVVGCIKNRPLHLIMETVSRDGREALRKLDAEAVRWHC